MRLDYLLSKEKIKETLSMVELKLIDLTRSYNIYNFYTGFVAQLVRVPL